VLFYGGKYVGKDDDGHDVYEGGVIGDIDNRIRKILNAPGLKVHKGEGARRRANKGKEAHDRR
jgi:hypothetical protein